MSYRGNRFQILHDGDPNECAKVSSTMIPRFSLSRLAQRFCIRPNVIIGSCSWESMPSSNQFAGIPMLRSLSSSSRSTRYDPTARRPTRRCDPYGQEGNPMAYSEAERLKPTIHIDWIFEMPEEETPVNHEAPEAPAPPKPTSTTERSNSSSESRFMSAEEVQKTLANLMQDTKATSGSKVFPMVSAAEELQRVLGSMPSSESAPLPAAPPRALVRSFPHPDFVSATRFLQTVAAVAQVNAHYPTLTVERKIINRHWITVSTIRCHTKVLDGLSPHDFHLAMVRESCAFSMEPQIVTHSLFHVAD
jgi:pterin-4a-carbinolamine dehydratase